MSVLDLANSLVGKVKYIFGANDVSGGKGDCSSFTQYVFKENGVNIGRTTNEQWQQGVEVSKENLQPGDLVFFKNTYNSGYKDGVSHVGIYAGNGKFIHNSSGAGGTTVSSLNSSYYQKHWLGARRVTGTTENNSNFITTGTTNTGLFGGAKDTIKNIASGAVKAVVILVLLILAFVMLTQGFGFKIGG